MVFDQDIRLLELFSGTGGFAKGLIEAGFRIREHLFSEIDRFAIANYQYNFSHAKNIGDVSKIKGKELKRPDILTFGSPCQDISLAGKRRGLKGKRSHLFFEAVRLIKECQPRLFIFENVKGLFSSNQGKDFEDVLKAFADLGLYDIQWQLLNTKWFLPQNRERVYLIGHFGEESPPSVFPIGESNQSDSKFDKEKPEGQDVSPTIDTGVGESTVRSPYVLHWKGSGKRWTFGKMENAPTVNTQTDWIRNPLVVKGNRIKLRHGLLHLPEATKKGFSTAMQGDAFNLSFLESNTRRARVGKGLVHTLKTDGNVFTLTRDQLRRLTPTECERLQGFPDGWTAYGNFDGEIKELSDTQRYKLMGNAVSVPVVKAIGLRLLGKTQPNIPSLELDIVRNLTLELELELLHLKQAA